MSYRHRVYRPDGTWWVDLFEDDTTRTVTTYNEAGATLTSRPYTSAESAALDARIAADQQAVAAEVRRSELAIAAVGIVNGTSATSSQIAAWRAAGIIVLSTSTAIADTTPPTWAATLTPTPDRNSVSIAASAPAQDELGVAGYECSTDSGVTWRPITPSGSTFTLTGLAAGTAYTVRLRALDSAGNASTPPLSTSFTTTQTSSAVTDDFNRADSAVTLGAATTGQVWSVVVGTAGIQSNRARAYTNSAKAVLDLGVPNMRVEADVSATGDYTGLLACWVDASNYYSMERQTSGAFKFYRTIAGATVAISGVTTAVVTAGQRIGLEVFETGSGARVSMLVDGVVASTATVTTVGRPVGTKGGLTLGLNSQTARFDNFSIQEVSA